MSRSVADWRNWELTDHQTTKPSPIAHVQAEVLRPGYNVAMQVPVPREQVQLSAIEVAQMQQIEDIIGAFECVEEHVLDQSLVFYITR